MSFTKEPEYIISMEGGWSGSDDYGSDTLFLIDYDEISRSNLAHGADRACRIWLGV